MHVDFKISIWERVLIPEEYEELVQEKIKSGEIKSAGDLIDLQLPDGTLIGDMSCEQLLDTNEQLTPKDNGGCSTVEIWENDSLDGNRNPMKMTWQNGNDR